MVAPPPALAPMTFRAREHTVTFPRRPLVMGIVNINDDSFSGDGTLDPQKALAQAKRFLTEGADVIDIGAESARTNRGPISETEEVSRLIPFLEAWPALIEEISGAPWDDDQLWPPLLSINTWRSGVVRSVLPLGGDLINDISGLVEGENAVLCASHGAALLIMHTVGLPKVPHTHVSYPAIMDELIGFFEDRIARAVKCGMPVEGLILDPGIDFAKQQADNLTIYRELAALHRFSRPILLPVSRKTVIGQVLCLPDPLDRDAGTIACISAGLRRGAQVFRVHNVKAAAQAAKVLWQADLTSGGPASAQLLGSPDLPPGKPLRA
jgi:dihydropteroate synthase